MLTASQEARGCEGSVWGGGCREDICMLVQWSSGKSNISKQYTCYVAYNGMKNMYTTYNLYTSLKPYAKQTY